VALDHEDALRALEKRVLKAGAGPWIATIEKMRRAEEAGDLALFADLLLSLKVPGIETAALTGLAEAYEMGTAHALDMIDSRAPRVVAESAAVRSAGARAVVPAAAAATVAKLHLDAGNALRQAERFGFMGARPDEILAPLRVSSNAIQRDVITTLHETASGAVVDVARIARAELVWVAERDACAHCLAMQGQVVAAGDSPDYLQTYAAKPLPIPPNRETASRHPRCRCQWEIVYSIEYVSGLKREADRSILRGFSLPNESEKVRVDAAARLLEKGVDAPKSVKAYAERAVRRGAFPTRAVPSG